MSKLYDDFVTVLGQIKLFRWPFWVVYDPGAYKIRGPEIREICGLLRPGDILLRRYDGYLDSHIITGTFSHAALYLGPVDPSDEVAVPPVGRRSVFFSSGREQVAHSTAEGVHLEDILTFLQCDGVAVLRFPRELTRLPAPPPRPADFATWHPEEQILYNRLEAGESIPFQQVFDLVRPLALGQMGTPYDFSFDFIKGNRLSCTKFVAHCYRGVLPALGVVPTLKSFFLGLRHKLAIVPDDFLETDLAREHITPQAMELLLRARTG
jgi:hypothetical protein